MVAEPVLPVALISTSTISSASFEGVSKSVLLSPFNNSQAGSLLMEYVMAVSKVKVDGEGAKRNVLSTPATGGI